MNKVVAERYRAQLNEQLAVLLNHGDGTVEQLEDESTSPADPNDRASLESDRSFDLRLRDRDRRLISKIREALQRIEEGTFGTCEDCGHDIEERRLAARPVTNQCIECKEDAERRENRGRLAATPEADEMPVAEPARRRGRPARG